MYYPRYGYYGPRPRYGYGYYPPPPPMIYGPPPPPRYGGHRYVYHRRGCNIF